MGRMYYNKSADKIYDFKEVDTRGEIRSEKRNSSLKKLKINFLKMLSFIAGKNKS